MVSAYFYLNLGGKIMDSTIWAAIIGGLFVIAATLLGIWLKMKIQNKPHHNNGLPKSSLSNCFALGFSIVGIAATGKESGLSSQRTLCLRSVKESSKKLGIKIPSSLKKPIPLDEFIDGDTIPSLRNKIRRKYGHRASSAFELGIWLAVSPLSEETGRGTALRCVEDLAPKVGLETEFVTNFVEKARKISDHIEFADEVTRFIMKTLKKIEGI